jgi:LysM repeat protein
MKYVAIGVSILGMGACTHKADLKKDADFSYAETPPEAMSLEEAQNFRDPPKADAYLVKAPRHSGVAYRASKFPEIASKPFQKDGLWMNSYMFVRGEQNWKQISRLLYGREDRANLLAQWNAGRELRPGTIIYYNSPLRADDSTSMKVLEDDFGLSLEGLIVKKGDSLSLIAARVYGSPEAWREIASLNQDLIPSPDVIEVGQNLRISPSVRNTQAVLQAAIKKMQAEAEAILARNAQVDTPQAESPPQDEAFADSQRAQAPPAEELASSNTVSDFNTTPLAQEASSEALSINDALFLLGALSCLSGVAFLVIRRRKAAAKEAKLVRFGKTGSED